MVSLQQRRHMWLSWLYSWVRQRSLCLAPAMEETIIPEAIISVVERLLVSSSAVWLVFSFCSACLRAVVSKVCLMDCWRCLVWVPEDVAGWSKRRSTLCNVKPTDDVSGFHRRAMLQSQTRSELRSNQRRPGSTSCETFIPIPSLTFQEARAQPCTAVSGETNIQMTQIVVSKAKARLRSKKFLVPATNWLPQ